MNPLLVWNKAVAGYGRWVDLWRSHGVGIGSLDCDVCIDELIPVWLDNGVYTVFPIEIHVWNGAIQP